MKAEFKTVTPQMAEYYLGKNTANRKISERRVRTYERDLLNGNFGTTHQGIAFYNDGSLADGQHRLLAIVKANRGAKLLVVSGIKKEDAIHIDSGRARSMSDSIRIGELSDWIEKRHIAMINLVAEPYRLTADETITWLENMEESAKFAIEHLSCNKRNLTNSAIHGAVALAHFYGEDHEKLAHFCNVFLSGIPDGNKDIIIIRLRDDFMSNTGGGGSDKRDRFWKAQRAIQIFTSGEKVKRLVLPKEPVWVYAVDA
jgi:hypothetical protein